MAKIRKQNCFPYSAMEKNVQLFTLSLSALNCMNLQCYINPAESGRCRIYVTDDCSIVMQEKSGLLQIESHLTESFLCNILICEIHIVKFTL